MGPEPRVTGQRTGRSPALPDRVLQTQGLSRPSANSPALLREGGASLRSGSSGGVRVSPVRAVAPRWGLGGGLTGQRAATAALHLPLQPSLHVPVAPVAP